MKTAQRKQNAASDASTKKSRNAITSYTKVGTYTMKTAKQKQKTVDFQGFSSTDAVGKVSACASSLLKPLQHGSPGLETCIVNKTKDMPELGSGQSLNYSSKLKLQLFPIDDVTRQGLEKDNHNPYLELTLSSRKKISSVVKHLNIKWGNSRTASGELVLFPYDVELKNLVCNVRWTMKETNTSAADVYSAIGSPEIFRLKCVCTNVFFFFLLILFYYWLSIAN
ncbi:TSL-kinase interacting protein 1 [Acorus gramineus]|uniref:TSL-kinase interacting protein 1 n=1 Tax=Acorus gramineus TaxID=55184 RepID=A0AAV9A6K6_ACOGR|nr:TSL-kinase interacting protein 1 [Acorus gramineus]